jgi:hypothetical protein
VTACPVWELRERAAELAFQSSDLGAVATRSNHCSIFAKGLVTWVESTEDRRVRIVALTPRGKDLIVSAFRKHSGQMKRVFSELSPEELRCLEVALKKVGKRAFALNGAEEIRDENNGRP